MSTDKPHFQISPLPGNFGAQVHGLDMRSADETVYGRLSALLYEHHVLVLRDQHLSQQQYIDFARHWGSIVPYFQERWTLPGFPEILMITNEAVPGRALPPAENWHADGTYLETPHSATMLYGQEAPREGGETWFANISAAYEGLSPEMKEKIRDLQVLHVKNGGLHMALPEEHERALTLETQTTPDERARLKPVKHPMVMHHPVTGKPALFVSTTTAYGIDAMDEGEAVQLIRELKQHALRPEYRNGHKVMPGDIMIWDNYSVLHKAAPTPLSNADGERRLLYRITVNDWPKSLAA